MALMHVSFAMGYPLSPSSLDIPPRKSSSGPEAPVPKSARKGRASSGPCATKSAKSGDGSCIPHDN